MAPCGESPGACAPLGGAGGARGASSRRAGGRAGTGTQVEPPDQPGRPVHPFPEPTLGGSPLLPGSRDRAPTTLSQDPKGQSPAGSEDPGGGSSRTKRLELGGGDGAAQDEPEASGCGRGWPAATTDATSLFSPALWGLCGLN